MNNWTPELDKQLKSVDYTQFLPMGRSRKLMQLTPQSIQQASRAFEADVAKYELAQKKQIVQEMMRRRALAAKLQAQQAFQKVWPEGSSEQLVKNFIKKKPVFSPRQFFK